MRANIPKLRTSELANIPERPQFNLSDAYRAAMSAPTAQHKGVLVEGSSSVSASSPRRHVALPSARRRMRELQNGKTQLQATHVNFNPTFREAKPLALSSDASAAAALRRPSGGPAASSSGAGEDDGADNNKLLKGLMMMLNSDNLADMKREFGKYKERGFDVAEFVDVMVRQLTRSSFGAGTAEEREEERAEREALVAKLAELFTQVDVNGDGSMEWSELTSYIVESHAKPEPPMPEFHAVPPLLDQSRLKSGQRIERVFYVAPLDLVLLCEAPQSVVSIYSPRQAACLHELRGHRAEVLAVEYVAVAGCLVTSGADLALCWWDTSGKEEHRSWKLRQRAPLPTCQQALRWSGQASLLFSGGDDGYILGWDMSTLECVVTLHAHKQAVTSMILLSEATDLHKKAELLATASLDGSVRLWNVAQRKDGKCAPREMHVLLGHERGVTCLAFVPAHKLLFSAGLDL